MSHRPIALVTGASSGVGRCAAVLLAGAGYDLALVARTEAKLRETADLAAAEARHELRCEVLPTDLTDAAATRAAVSRTVEAFGRLDAIANVAGAAPLMPIAKVTEADWRRCIDANLSYVVNITAAAWPTLAAQKAGVIVNVSSMASIDPFPGFAMYAAAKIGVNMFTQCTAAEGRPIDVKAVVIAPGAIETPMLRSLFDEKMIPRDKTLDPRTVAEVIRDCITARAFEPGEVIVMDSP